MTTLFYVKKTQTGKFFVSNLEIKNSPYTSALQYVEYAKKELKISISVEGTKESLLCKCKSDRTGETMFIAAIVNDKNKKEFWSTRTKMIQNVNIANGNEILNKPNNQKHLFYAVYIKCSYIGLIRLWKNVEEKVKGVSGAHYKGFSGIEEAKQWFASFNIGSRYYENLTLKDVK